MINAGTICSFLTLDTNSFSAGIGSAIAQLGTLKNSSAGVGEQIQVVGGAINTVGLGMTKNFTVPLLGAGAAAGKFSIDFESAFVGVRKTVDATEAEYADLRKGILDMTHDIPASAVEISGVVEAAGQLGIQTDNILDFSRTMIDLGESTNLSAQQGATELARFANITRMSQKDFSRLGSTIVALGNNLATTESEISSMGLRLAGAGHQVGMTEAEILGLAGALSSVGIEAEAGGSGMSKVIVQMQLAAQSGAAAKDELAKTGYTLRELQLMSDQDAKSFKGLASELGYTTAEFKNLMNRAQDLDNFSQICKMSGEEFSKAFRKDAAGTIMQFVSGLGEMKSNGGDVIAVLENMGITEVRMRDALLRAAGAGDVFAKAIGTATDAWEENTALAREAEQRYASTESQLKLLWNDVKALGIELGDEMLPIIRDVVGGSRDLIKGFSGLDDSTKKFIITTGLLLATAGPTTSLIGKTVNGLGSLVKGADKGAQLVGKLGTKMSGLGGTLGGVGSKLAPLSGGFSRLGLTLSKFIGPAGIAVGVGVAFVALTKHINDSLGALDRETAEHIRNSSANIRSFIGTLDEAKSLTTDFQWQVVEAGQEASAAFLEQIGTFNNGISTLVTDGMRVTRDAFDNSSSQIKGLVADVKGFIDSQTQEQTQSLINIWTSSGTLMDAENQSILKKLTESGEEKKKKYDDIEKQIDGIMSGAINGRGYLLEEEKNEILALMSELQEALSVDAATYADYQKAVLTRIKSESSTITFDTAQTLIKTSEEARDKRIAAAQQTCDEEVAALQRTLETQENLSSRERQALEERVNEKQRILHEEVAAAKQLHDEAVNDVAARYSQENQTIFDAIQQVAALNEERAAKEAEHQELMNSLYEGSATEQEERALRLQALDDEMFNSRQEYERKVTEIFNSIKDGQHIAFMEMINDTITSGGTLSAENEAIANAILEAYTLLPPEMEQTARAGMESLLTGMTDSRGQAIDTSKMTVQEMAALFKELPKSTEESGKQTAAGFSKGYFACQPATLKGVHDGTQALIDEINTTLDCHSPSKKTEKSGLHAAQGLGVGMEKGKGSLITQSRGIGIDIIRGMEAGLDSRKSALISKANSIANQITRTIRKALDIHSPSRVMRGIGENVMVGWGLGMDDNIDKVVSPAREAIDDILGIAAISPDVKLGFDARREAISSDIGKREAIAQAADHLTRSNPVQYLANVILQIDGKDVAKGTAVWNNALQGEIYNQFERIGEGI